MSTPPETVEIYCVKCRARTLSRHITPVTMKNGCPATRSTCVDCGATKFRIGAIDCKVRPEVMTHYRASVEKNRLLAKLLAQ